MKGRGLKGKGASYQMIHRYLPKASNPHPTVPPEDFLRAAAEVLSQAGRRVRWTWLATGAGEPTESEEHAHTQAERIRAVVEQDAEERLTKRMEAALLEELPRLRDGALTQTWDRLWELANYWMTHANFFTRHPRWELPTMESRRTLGAKAAWFDGAMQEQAVREVAQVLRAPAEAAGIRLEDLSDHHLNLYLAAASTAIYTLVTNPERLQLRKPRPTSSDYYETEED